MISLVQAMEQAARKPIEEWNMEETLAVKIFKSDSEVRRLQKQLQQAEELSSRLKQRWNSLMQQRNNND